MLTLVLLLALGCDTDDPVRGPGLVTESPGDDGSRPHVTMDQPVTPLSGTLVFTGTAWDDDQPASTLVVRLRSSRDGRFFRSNPDGTGHWTWTGTLSAGEHDISVEVLDSQGHIARTGRTLLVVEPSEEGDNHHPSCSIVTPITDAVLSGPAPHRFEALAGDADGDPMSLTWRDIAGTVLSDQPVFYATLEEGPHQVLLLVEDDRGGQCLADARFTVTTEQDTGIIVVPPDSGDTAIWDTGWNWDTGSWDTAWDSGSWDTGSWDTAWDSGSWDSGGDTANPWLDGRPFDVLLAIEAEAQIRSGSTGGPRWEGLDHWYVDRVDNGRRLCEYTYDTRGTPFPASATACVDKDGNVCDFAFEVTAASPRTTLGDCSLVSSSLPLDYTAQRGYIADFQASGYSYGPFLMYYYTAPNGTSTWYPVTDTTWVAYDSLNAQFGFDLPINTYTIP